jgi:hypothetical protein
MTEKNELLLEILRSSLALKETEISLLKSQLATLKIQASALAVSAATPIVRAAVLNGRIPSNDYQLQAKWIQAIAGDPTLAQTLTADGGIDDQQKGIRILNRARKIQKEIGVNFANAFAWATTQEACGSVAQAKAAAMLDRALVIRASGVPFADAFNAATREMSAEC